MCWSEIPTVWCAQSFPRENNLWTVQSASARDAVWFCRGNWRPENSARASRDDIVETLFLNLFFGGKLKAMPPKLLSDDKKNVVIRPLAYCKESDIEAYANQKPTQSFPVTYVVHRKTFSEWR